MIGYFIIFRVCFSSLYSSECDIQIMMNQSLKIMLAQKDQKLLSSKDQAHHTDTTATPDCLSRGDTALSTVILIISVMVLMFGITY